jgi:hypothetical protein
MICLLKYANAAEKPHGPFERFEHAVEGAQIVT